MSKSVSDDELQKTANIFWAAGQSQIETSRIMGLSRNTIQNRLDLIEKRGIKPRVRVSGGKVDERPAPRIAKVVWFTDAHNQPDMPLDRFYWLAGLVNDVKPDYLIDGGDFDDLNSLCGHEGNETWKGKFKPAFMDDLAASEEARSLLDNLITHPCKKHFILGNHEDRLYAFENRNPEVYGMMQHAYLQIHRNWQITPYKAYLDIEGVDFTHVPMNGMNKPVSAKNPSYSVASNSIRDVCFGHTHSFGITPVDKYGPNRRVLAINGGCYMPDKYVPKYAQGSAKGYWYGAWVIEISEGRIVGHTPITMRELKDRYS